MAVDPFYAEMQQAARDLVGFFNQDALDVVTQTVTQPSDPRLPPTVVTTERRYEAVARGVTAQMRIADPLLSDASVRVTIDAAQGYVPQVADVVKISGKSGAIVRVDPIPAMGPICAYVFYVEA